MLKRFTNNWTLKLTSLILAVALWSHVRGEVNPWETATFRVALGVSPPRNMVLSSDSKPPSIVRVTLRGPRSSLRLFKGSAPPNPLAPADEVPLVGSDQLTARLEFATARKGRQEVTVTAETGVEDVEVIGIKPATVELTLDRAESDKFTVNPQFSPSALEDLRLDEIVVTPPRAEVFGPSTVLERVVTVRALADDRVLVPGAMRLTQVRLVALDGNDKVVSGVQVEPQVAQIRATVREEQATKELRLAPRLKGELADGYLVTSTSITPERVTVRGPARALREQSNLRVTLDVSRAADDIRRSVRLTAPAGLTIVGDERATVTVNIRRSAAVVQATAEVPRAESPARRRENPSRSEVRPSDLAPARSDESDLPAPAPAPNP